MLIKEISLCIQTSTDDNLLLLGTRVNRKDTKALVNGFGHCSLLTIKRLRIDKTNGVLVMTGI